MSLNSLSCDPSFQNLSFFQPFPAGAKEWWWWYLTSTSTVKLVTFRLSLLSVCLQVSDTFICSYVTASVNKKKIKLLLLLLQEPETSGSFRWSTNRWRSHSPQSYASSPCVTTLDPARKFGSGKDWPKLSHCHNYRATFYYVWRYNKSEERNSIGK